MITYFLKGGILIWPLFFLSVFALAIILEKLWLFKKAKNELNDIDSKINELKDKEDLNFALLENLIKEKKIIYSVITFVLKKIKVRKTTDVKEVIELSVRQKIRELEKHLDWLATIAGASPLLGFLGTVIGMVKAFQVIEVTGGPVNPSLLAGGIWEALLTTIYGLGIAIPCVFFYNFLINQIEDIVFKLEISVNNLIEKLTW